MTEKISLGPTDPVEGDIMQQLAYLAGQADSLIDLLLSDERYRYDSDLSLTKISSRRRAQLERWRKRFDQALSYTPAFIAGMNEGKLNDE